MNRLENVQERVEQALENESSWVNSRVSEVVVFEEDPSRENHSFFDDGNWHVVRNGVRVCFDCDQNRYPMNVPARLQEALNRVVAEVVD